MGLRRILQEGQPKTNLITGAILGNQIYPEGKCASTQSEKFQVRFNRLTTLVMFQSCVTLEDNWKPSYRNWMWDLSALRDGKLGSWTSGSLKGLYQQKANLTQPFSLYFYFWELMTFLALNFLSCWAEEPSLVWILCGWQLVCQYIAEISRLVAQDSGTYQTWLSCFLALLVRKVFLFSLFWFYCGDHEGQPMSNCRFGSVSPKPPQRCTRR